MNIKCLIMPEDMPYTITDIVLEVLTLATGVGGILGGVHLSQTVKEQIPIHFNMSFEPDAWGTADSLLILAALGLIIPLFILFRLRFPNLAKANLPGVADTLGVRKLMGRYLRISALLCSWLMLSACLMSVYWNITAWRVVFILFLSLLCLMGLVMVIHLPLAGKGRV